MIFTPPLSLSNKRTEKKRIYINRSILPLPFLAPPPNLISIYFESWRQEARDPQTHARRCLLLTQLYWDRDSLSHQQYKWVRNWWGRFRSSVSHSSLKITKNIVNIYILNFIFTVTLSNNLWPALFSFQIKKPSNIFFPHTLGHFTDKIMFFLNWVYVICHSSLANLTARWLGVFFSVRLTPTLNQAYTVDISPLLNCLSAPLGQIWPCTYVGPQLGCSETSGHQGLQPSGPSKKNHFSNFYFF